MSRNHNFFPLASIRRMVCSLFVVSNFKIISGYDFVKQEALSMDRQKQLKQHQQLLERQHLNHQRHRQAQRREKFQTSELHRIAGQYVPTFDVSDLAAIDLDQQEMEELILSRKLNHAKLLYEEGGHSMSYAILNIINPKGDGFYPAESKVWGYNDQGLQITGTTLDEISWKSNSNGRRQLTTKTIKMATTAAKGILTSIETMDMTNSTKALPVRKMSISSSAIVPNVRGVGSSKRLAQTSNTSAYYMGNITVRVLYDRMVGYTPHCQVGALHIVSAGYTQNCFAHLHVIRLGRPGSSQKDSVEYNYTYNVHTENKNLRSLRTIAKDSPNLFRGRVYDFDLFSQVYATDEYADVWSMAAADGNATNFKSGFGNADFSLLKSRFGRGEGLLKGSVFLNLYMYVIGKLSLAVNACYETKQDVASLSLDEAVAVYAGSLTSDEANDGGLLMYGLADDSATNFKTAGHIGDHDEGSSYVNIHVMKHFKRMQVAIQRVTTTINNNNVSTSSVTTTEVCNDAATSFDEIKTLMKIPILQSVLRYAYVRDREFVADSEDIDKAQGKGATYTAAILPYIYNCSPTEAKTLYENMRFGAVNVDFLAVKAALERTYSCLNVTCHNVGGLWNGTNYVVDASPCNYDGTMMSTSNIYNPKNNPSSSLGIGGIIGIALGSMICTIVVISAVRHRNSTSLFACHRRNKNNVRRSMDELTIGSETIMAVSEIS